MIHRERRKKGAKKEEREQLLLRLHSQKYGLPVVLPKGFTPNVQL
jgi:hypothetical protein